MFQHNNDRISRKEERKREEEESIHPPNQPPRNPIRSDILPKRIDQTPIMLQTKNPIQTNPRSKKENTQYPIRLHPPSKASPPTNLPIFSSSTSSNTLELRISHILVAVFPI
jgi:hypothetical protein